jgi:integrase
VHKVGTKRIKQQPRQAISPKRETHKFTATRVATLPPGRYKDPAQESLYLLVRPKKDGSFSRTWLHRLKSGGRDVPFVVGHFPQTGLHEARSAVQEQREQISKGIDPLKGSARKRRKAKPGTAPAPLLSGGKYSIEFLASEFLELHVKENHRDPSYAKRILDKDVLAETAWRGRDARTIKPREVIELFDGIVARGASVMANRTRTTLWQMFEFGIHRAIVETNPVPMLYRPGGKEPARDRCLSDAELKALLADPKAATRFDRLAHVIVILLTTGQRRGELALARWIDIDFNEKLWRIPAAHTKTGKATTVPLSGLAILEFEALQRLAKHNRYVLPNDAGDGPADPKLLTRGVARCLPRMKKLKIEAFTLHDLRRTCRTGLARLKILPHIAERVLNHAQEKIPGTYDKYDYLDEKREALDKWAAHLVGLVQP